MGRDEINYGVWVVLSLEINVFVSLHLCGKKPRVKTTRYVVRRSESNYHIEVKKKMKNDIYFIYINVKIYIKAKSRLLFWEEWTIS